jgi:hypothetical protein
VFQDLNHHQRAHQLAIASYPRQEPRRHLADHCDALQQLSQLAHLLQHSLETGRVQSHLLRQGPVRLLDELQRRQLLMCYRLFDAHFKVVGDLG